MQLDQLFETPLIFTELRDSAELNRGLVTAIEQRRSAAPQGVAISNRLGWHSDTEMLEWGGDPAHRLMDAVIDIANRYTLDIAGKGRRRFIWVPEMWANVSGSGASNQLHSHAGSFWSAVYYVHDGYRGSPDRRLGGEIEIEDPRTPMINMEAPDLRFRPGKDAEPATHEVLIRPATGRLLMFPGWLRHAVKPYFGDGTRISIAMNLTALRVPMDVLAQHPHLPGPPAAD
jgi:uncharacterized protein (TIGR02466 family)